MVFCANIPLRIVEVQIRTIGCTGFFPCGVWGPTLRDESCWRRSDQIIPGPMVAAILPSQSRRHTSSVSPLRFSIYCMSLLTLCCRFSSARLPCFVCFCAHCNKIIFFRAAFFLFEIGRYSPFRGFFSFLDPCSIRASIEFFKTMLRLHQYTA